MLMQPAPPKREEDLAEHVDMWRDKMRRLEAHGEEFKLAPVFKINALRTLMIGRSSTSTCGSGQGPHEPEQVVRGAVGQGEGLLKKEKVG